MVTFRLNQQTYALPIEPIAQIIEMVTITPILEVEDSVEGVINVRGTAVPVVNLRRKFGLPEAPLQLDTPIILVQVDHRKVGLIVDEVIGVLSLASAQVIRTADILPERLDKAPLLQGLAHTSDGTVLLLEPERLFLPHQRQALAQAAATLPEMVEKETSLEQAGPEMGDKA